MDKEALTIALPKGRLLGDCVRLFVAAGVHPEEDPERSRRLIIPSTDRTARFLIVRDKDLPAYVDHGAADLGVAGSDVLLEAGRDLLEPLDLGFGRCRIVVACPSGAAGVFDPGRWGHARVATKYPVITAGHFAARGEQVEIIPLYGSIELAPAVGLADRIVDLVSTGETLRQNRLVELEEVVEVSARLVVNRASLKMKGRRLVPLIRALERAAGGLSGEGDEAAPGSGGGGV